MSEEAPEAPQYITTARYGSMRFVDVFRTRAPDLRKGDAIVVRTDRGVELGEVLVAAEPLADQPEDFARGASGEVLRRVMPEDLEKQDEIERENQPAEFGYCVERIRERNLPMKLVSVEHLLGGRKIIFYFLADGRVDFRELVRDLAQEYHCRIEMRQIGVRDEARLLADHEHCGQPLCCHRFIKKLEPVSMRMAKCQKATLDPSKISGRCGRLMCCLRFEDAHYEANRRSLPRRGQRVQTPKGEGVVSDVRILLGEVQVELREGGQEVFAGADVQIATGRKPGDSGGRRRRGRGGDKGPEQDPPKEQQTEG